MRLGRPSSRLFLASVRLPRHPVTGMIRGMQYRIPLLIILIIQSAVGVGTIHSASSPDQRLAARIAWGLFLILLPLILCGSVGMGWTWAAMACVIYGTIGLALDLATLTSILGGQGGTDTMLALSGISGGLNLLLIIFGGRAFWSGLQNSPPQGSRPPSPQSPSSS